MIWGILIGVAVMAIAYFLSMLAYFAVRKRLSSTKYAVEVVTVLIALLLSVGVKFAIFVSIAPDTLGSGFATVLYAVYSGLGGLAFEGLQDLSEINGALIQCLYTGTSLYAGIMFVSVFTAKASYEIYSYLQLFFLRIRLRFTDDIDIYLFTAVTEEAILIADSICEHKRKLDKSCDGEAKKCKIIFSGDSLDSFDRSDRLHREIMANGYLYWSYSKKNNVFNAESVLKKLGLYIGVKPTFIHVKDDKKAKNEPNEQELSRKEMREKRREKQKALMDRALCATEIRKNGVHVFSLSKNARLSGLESENGEEVFEETEALTHEHLKSMKRQNIPINFYILTENDVNYEYYENKLDTIIKNAFNTIGKDILKDDNIDQKVKLYKSRFQIHIINEALLAGKCLANERISALSRENAEGKSLLLADNMPNEDNTYRVIMLGFGDNGREAMKTLFTDTAYVDGEGVPSQFVVDVYDKDAQQKAGLFSVTHPMFVCKNCDSAAPVDVKNLGDKYFKIEASFKSAPGCGNGKIKSFEDVKKYMQFPVLGFHNASCFDLDFMDFLDGKSGIETSCSNKTFYNAFVIALGDDELNISMANSLIDDMKHELLLTKGNKSVYPQSVYINIRDEKNYERINWTEKDKMAFPDLNVIKFGNRKLMYSYEYIVDSSLDMRYNHGYNLSASKALQAYEAIAKILESGVDGDKSLEEDLINIKREVNFKDVTAIAKEWLTVSMFLKESNVVARRFGAYIGEGLRREKALSAETLSGYAELEHNRWNRFHIANGWIYAPYPRAMKAYRRSIKEHNCLCPFDMLCFDDVKYDFVNVAMAWRLRPDQA